MKVTRCIALVAIAGLAACSEQSQQDVTAVRFDDRVAVIGDFSVSTYYNTTSCSATTPPEVMAFAVAGTPDFNPADSKTQFSIIAPERTIPINHGAINSYIVRNGWNAIYATLSNVNDAIVSSGFGGTPVFFGSKDSFNQRLTFTGVLGADLNGDAYPDAIVFTPVSSLGKVGIIGPERSLVLKAFQPSRGGIRNPQGDVTVGGTAPCSPTPPPPPLLETFTH